MTVAVALDGSRSQLSELPDTLAFVESPPGMAGLIRFDLAPLDEAGFLFSLRSVDSPGVRLFVIPPQAYFADYSPEVSASVREALDLPVGVAPVMLAVVHPSEGEGTTANLLAPIVVNPVTGIAAQVVLDSDEWPLRAPLGASSTAA